MPPTPKGRRHEVRALALRDFAGLTSDSEQLDPFQLARFANLRVATFEEVKPFLSEASAQHLLGDGKDGWSGGACSQALPDGTRLIILNPTHPPNRQRATLMEEICHVFLGHEPTRLAFEGEDGSVRARDYNHKIEEQAYSVGAAALVPYSALRRMVIDGWTSRRISRHFAVSRELVEFRIKISRLWQTYGESVVSGMRGAA